MAPFERLMRKNEADMADFVEWMDHLAKNHGPKQYIADLKRRASEAQKSNAILRAAIANGTRP